MLPAVLTACAAAAPRALPASAPGRTAPAPSGDVVAQEPVGELIGGFRITNYTLAREADLSGQRTGNRTRIAARGLPGAYAWEFLCSGRGVAMQGTGITVDGKFVHYVSGGNGFCGRDQHLCDCKGAQFALTTGVFGATGRALVENYSIAVDPAVIPYGSYVWIDAMKRWFRADDTGGAIRGRHIDVYVGTQPFVFNGETAVLVATEPHEANDPGPSASQSSCAREALVCGGEGGEAHMLHRCHDGHLSFARACTWGCQRGHGGADDACKPRPPMTFCADNGLFCGGDRVDGRPGVLYRCADHGLGVEEVCGRGCSVDPDGLSDRCD
jgi:3D (Asp-Asp-Asp) domain-containing protein